MPLLNKFICKNKSSFFFFWKGYCYGLGLFNELTTISNTCGNLSMVWFNKPSAAIWAHLKSNFWNGFFFNKKFHYTEEESFKVLANSKMASGYCSKFCFPKTSTQQLFMPLSEVFCKILSNL